MKLFQISLLLFPYLPLSFLPTFSSVSTGLGIVKELERAITFIVSRSFLYSSQDTLKLKSGKLFSWEFKLLLKGEKCVAKVHTNQIQRLSIYETEISNVYDQLLSDIYASDSF